MGSAINSPLSGRAVDPPVCETINCQPQRAQINRKELIHNWWTINNAAFVGPFHASLGDSVRVRGEVPSRGRTAKAGRTHLVEVKGYQFPGPSGHRLPLRERGATGNYLWNLIKSRRLFVRFHAQFSRRYRRLRELLSRLFANFSLTPGVVDDY